MIIKERYRIILFSSLLILLVIIYVIPWLWSLYHRQLLEISQSEQRIQRYEKLIEDTELLQERVLTKQREVDAFSDWAFKGNNQALMGTSLQQTLRKVVDASGVTIREMSVTRFSKLEGRNESWTLILQDMSFALEEKQILSFLKELEAQRPKLFITTFSLQQNRRQINGNLTVVGFGLEAAE
jgi:hypothetical protein